MSLNLVVLLYLIASVLFIQALKGLSHPTTSRTRQHLRHGRHGRSRVFTTVALIVEAARRRTRRRRPRLGRARRGRRRHGRHPDGQAGRDDQDAGTGRLHAFDDRPGGGLHRDRRRGRALGVQHRRQGRADPGGQPARALHRHLRRRDHLLRLGHRLRQAVGQVQVPPVPGRAGHVPRPAPAEPGAGPGDARLRRLVLHDPAVGAVLADDAHRLRARRADHHPDRRRRHAGRGLDAQQLLGLGRGRHRLLAQQPDADHRRLAGRLVRRDPVLHHVQGDEPVVLQRDPGRLRRRDRRAPRPPAAKEQRPVKSGSADDAAFLLANADSRDRRARLRPGGGPRAASAEGADRQARSTRASTSSTRSIRWPAGCRGT